MCFLVADTSKFGRKAKEKEHGISSYSKKSTHCQKAWVLHPQRTRSAILEQLRQVQGRRKLPQHRRLGCGLRCHGGSRERFLVTLRDKGKGSCCVNTQVLGDATRLQGSTNAPGVCLPTLELPAPTSYKRLDHPTVRRLTNGKFPASGILERRRENSSPFTTGARTTTNADGNNANTSRTIPTNANDTIKSK